MARNVNDAQMIPNLPILSAIVSSFSWRRVGPYLFIDLRPILPAIEFPPTARTRPFPNPEQTRDLAMRVPASPFL